MDAIVKYGPEEIRQLDEKSKKYQSHSRSDATKNAYRSDWQLFVEWCSGTGTPHLPAEPATVRRYITHLADIGRAVSTISRTMTSISQAHKIINLQSPTSSPEVSEVWKGIKRQLGTAQTRAKPLLLSELKKVISGTRPTFIGRRDSALILVGWAAAMRRSEIIALDVEDIDFVEEGMVVNIRRSKTDQNSEGYKIGIPYAREEKFCPVCHLKRWIRLSGTVSGAIFFRIGMGGKKFLYDVRNPTRLSVRMVNVILKRRLERCGMDSRGYSGHSMRAGFVTEAARGEVPEALIQIQTRHRTTKVLRGYIRDGSLFINNPLSILL